MDILEFKFKKPKKSAADQEYSENKHKTKKRSH